MKELVFEYLYFDVLLVGTMSLCGTLGNNGGLVCNYHYQFFFLLLYYHSLFFFNTQTFVGATVFAWKDTLY